MATCELRFANSLSGSTVNLDSGLIYAHSSGATVVLTNSDEFSTTLWGATMDSTTNDWAAVQRATIETDRISVWMTGMGQQHQFRQPIYGNNTHMRRIVLRAQGSAFSPIDATNGGAWVSIQDAPKTFTVDPSTDTFTTPSAHGIGAAGNKIAFNNPGGETLPGGITSGQVYFIKTVPTSTTFTIATTSGGSTVDITSTGTGWCYPDINALEKIYFDDVYFKGSTGNANLIMLRTCLQQPAETRKLRIDGSAGGGVPLWYLTGQISNHFNTEINLDPNNIGIQIGDSAVFSSGHNFHGVNMTGGDLTGTVGIKFENCQSIYFSGLWLEHIRQQLLFGTLGSGIFIDQFFTSGGVAGDSAITIPNSASHSISIGTMVPYSYNGTNIISDSYRSLTLTQNQIADSNGHILGYTQPAGGVAPVFRNRKVVSKTTTYTVTIVDELVKADATGGAFTVTLMDSTHIAGFRVTIKKIDSSGNAVTVGTTSSQTIDGVTTKSLASQYDKVTVESDGSNWMVVG